MKKLLVLAVAIIALVLAGCSSLSSPKEVEYTIEMTEFAYNPDTIELKVGQQVTLHLVNKGVLEHEVMFGREVQSKDGHPNGYHVDLFEAAGVEPVIHVEGAALAAAEDGHDQGEAPHDEGEAGHDEAMDEEMAADGHVHSGFMLAVPEGADGYTIRFTVTEDMVGEWEIGCFLQGGSHYEAGMVGKLIVTN